MPRSVSVPEAMLHLSRLVEEVKAGEEIVLTKAGRPVARLVPLETPKRRREVEYAPAETPPEALLAGQVFEDWDLQT